MKMKLNLFVLAIFVSGLVFSQKTKVEFVITYTQPYCGGARPSEEIQKEAEKPKPYAGMTLVVVNEKNKIDSLKTDDRGTFRKNLKKGTYKVYEAWRYNLYTPNNQQIELFDKTCLINEWQKPVLQIKVERKTFNLTILNPIQNFCDWQLPCLKDELVPPGRQ